MALGGALFFDPILSGNRDVACATCHLPTLGTSDALSLSVGTGGTGVGPERAAGDYPGFIPPRLDLYNRGDSGWTRLFWDARVEADADGALRTPLGDALPAAGVLAAQALFLLDRAEMLGRPATPTPGRPTGGPPRCPRRGLRRPRDAPHRRLPWAALDAAADGAPPDIALVANALAAWQTQELSFTGTPGRVAAGEADALPDDAKLGAVVLRGRACARCHSGALLSDQQTHVTAVPQLGPGLADSAPFDLGRGAVTGDPADDFAFRTTPLRNVALSAPYMHTGVYPDLESAVLHYANPVDGIADLDTSSLHPDLRDTVQDDPAHLDALRSQLSDQMVEDEAAQVGLSNVRAFMEALTDPAAEDLSALVPAAVPSGLVGAGALSRRPPHPAESAIGSRAGLGTPP